MEEQPVVAIVRLAHGTVLIGRDGHVVRRSSDPALEVPASTVVLESERATDAIGATIIVPETLTFLVTAWTFLIARGGALTPVAVHVDSNDRGTYTVRTNGSMRFLLSAREPMDHQLEKLRVVLDEQFPVSAATRPRTVDVRYGDRVYITP